MNKALRKAVIAGNWKMNKTPSEAKALIEEMKPLVKMQIVMLFSAYLILISLPLLRPLKVPI